MMHTMSGNMYWHHITYMYLYPTIVGLLILAGIVYLIYWLFAKQDVSLKKQSPLEILKLRYAKGEITEKQLQQMKKQLQEKG
ncbi:SHOCT domain-containing protein [Candidatus Woesearchaeota archaeon]|nr:SHOCT domain-containing protein [Candidatus Woesearchaeota archaeon]